MELNIGLLETNSQLLKINLELQDMAKQQHSQICDFFAPILRDTSLLPTIIQHLEMALTKQNYKEKIRVELFILIYLYSPISLFSEDKAHRYKTDSGELRYIADALNLQYFNMIKYKSSSLLHYRNYRDFRELTNATFKTITEIIDLPV